MELLLEMLRDEPNAVIGSMAAALAAAGVLLWDLSDEEDRIERMRDERG